MRNFHANFTPGKLQARDKKLAEAADDLYQYNISILLPELQQQIRYNAT